MRIAVNLQNQLGVQTGIGNFTRGLLTNIFSLDKENSYTGVFFIPFWKGFKKPTPFKPFSNLHYAYVRYLPYRVYISMAYNEVNLPFNLFTGKIDLFFFPDYYAFPTTSGKRLVLIYDITYVAYPEYGLKERIDFFTKMTKKTISRKDTIITISEFSKKELVEKMNVDEKLIHVVYPGVDEKFKPASPAAIEKVRNKYNIDKPYILFIGSIQTRKNLAVLVEAFQKFKDSYILVIAGEKSWGAEEVFAKVQSLKLNKQVKFTGYLPEVDKIPLLSGASVFAFPSLYEGFGLPILESQSVGTPVICSNTSSLLEAGGNGALFFNPNDVKQIESTLGKILSSETTRRKLIEKGFLNTKRFSWENSAKKTLEIFKSLR